MEGNSEKALRWQLKSHEMEPYKYADMLARVYSSGNEYGKKPIHHTCSLPIPRILMPDWLKYILGRKVLEPNILRMACIFMVPAWYIF
jgi:hypothetical protein